MPTFWLAPRASRPTRRTTARCPPSLTRRQQAPTRSPRPPTPASRTRGSTSARAHAHHRHGRFRVTRYRRSICPGPAPPVRNRRALLRRRIIAGGRASMIAGSRTGSSSAECPLDAHDASAIDRADQRASSGRSERYRSDTMGHGHDTSPHRQRASGTPRTR